MNRAVCEPIQMPTPDQPFSADQCLWAGVLIGAVQDALRKPRRIDPDMAISALSSNRAANNEITTARSWIRSDRTGTGTFLYCCDVCNIQPDAMRERIEKLISEGENGGKRKIRISDQTKSKKAPTNQRLGKQSLG